LTAAAAAETHRMGSAPHGVAVRDLPRVVGACHASASSVRFRPWPDSTTRLGRFVRAAARHGTGRSSDCKARYVWDCAARLLQQGVIMLWAALWPAAAVASSSGFAVGRRWRHPSRGFAGRPCAVWPGCATWSGVTAARALRLGSWVLRSIRPAHRFLGGWRGFYSRSVPGESVALPGPRYWRELDCPARGCRYVRLWPGWLGRAAGLDTRGVVRWSWDCVALFVSALFP